MKHIISMLIMMFCLCFLMALPQGTIEKIQKNLKMITQLNQDHFLQRVDTPAYALVETYDENNMIWEVSGKTVFTYNPAQKIVLAVNYVQVLPDSFIPSERYEYDYNENNQPVELRILMNLNPMGVPYWLTAVKMTAIYNEQHHLTHSYVYMSESGVLYPYYRNHVMYDDNNHIIQFLSWETSDNIESFAREDFTYENNRVNNIVHYTGEDSLNLVMDSKVEWAYEAMSTADYEDFNAILDNGGMMVMLFGNQFSDLLISTQTELDYENQSWVNSNRSVYTYNPQLKLTAQTDQYYMGSEWFNDIRYEYTYTTENQLLTQMNGEWDNNEWHYYSRYTFVYETSNHDVSAPVSNIQVTSYPNPFKAELNIKVKTANQEPLTVSLYDVKGRKIKSVMVKANIDEINRSSLFGSLDQLNSGVYFLRVSDSKESVCHKIIRIK